MDQEWSGRCIKSGGRGDVVYRGVCPSVLKLEEQELTSAVDRAAQRGRRTRQLSPSSFTLPSALSRPPESTLPTNSPPSSTPRLLPPPTLLPLLPQLSPSLDATLPSLAFTRSFQRAIRSYRFPPFPEQPEDGAKVGLRRILSRRGGGTWRGG